MSAAPARQTPEGRVYLIQGKEVGLPVVVRDASSGAATYLVRSTAARALIPSAFEPLEIAPGRALLSLAAIEYRDNDLGVYNEVSIAFFVRPKGERSGVPYAGTLLDFFRGRAATYIHRLPVNASFTCDGGRTIWGFPKTIEEIDITKTADRATCVLTCGGKHALTLALPRGGGRTLPEMTMATYSLIEGVPHRTSFTSGGTGVGFKLGGAKLALGEHPVAGELRRLGLPKRAVMTMWMEHMHGSFAAPVAIG